MRELDAIMDWMQITDMEIEEFILGKGVPGETSKPLLSVGNPFGLWTGGDSIQGYSIVPRGEVLPSRSGFDTGSVGVMDLTVGYQSSGSGSGVRDAGAVGLLGSVGRMEEEDPVEDYNSSGRVCLSDETIEGRDVLRSYSQMIDNGGESLENIQQQQQQQQQLYKQEELQLQQQQQQQLYKQEELQQEQQQQLQLYKQERQQQQQQQYNQVRQQQQQQQQKNQLREQLRDMPQLQQQQKWLKQQLQFQQQQKQQQQRQQQKQTRAQLLETWRSSCQPIHSGQFMKSSIEDSSSSCMRLETDAKLRSERNRSISCTMFDSTEIPLASSLTSKGPTAATAVAMTSSLRSLTSCVTSPTLAMASRGKKVVFSDSDDVFKYPVDSAHTGPLLPYGALKGGRRAGSLSSPTAALGEERGTYPLVSIQHGMAEIGAELSDLFKCLEVTYCNRLQSPRWNDFKGVELTIKKKIRLNNIIWREWFLQCRRSHRPIVCRFEAPGFDHSHKSPEAVVLEGRYWSRSYESVLTEYKKWRREHRRPSKDEQNLLQEVVELADQLERGVSLKNCRMTSTNLLLNSLPVSNLSNRSSCNPHLNPLPVSSLNLRTSSNSLLNPLPVSSLNLRTSSNPLFKALPVSCLSSRTSSNPLLAPVPVSTPTALDDVLTDQLFNYFLSRPQDFQSSSSSSSSSAVVMSTSPSSSGRAAAESRPRARRVGVSYPSVSTGSILTTLLQQPPDSGSSARDLIRQQLEEQQQQLGGGVAERGSSNRSSSGSSSASDHAPMDTSAYGSTIQEFADELWDMATTLTPRPFDTPTLSPSPLDCSQGSVRSDNRITDTLQTIPSSSSILSSSLSSSNLLSSLLFASNSVPVNLSSGAQLSPLSPTSPATSIKRVGVSKLEELLCLPIREDAQFQRPIGQPRTSHMRKLVSLDRNPRRASTGSLPLSQAHVTQRTWNYKSSNAGSESRQREIDKRRAPYINQGLTQETNQPMRNRQDSSLLPSYGSQAHRNGAGSRPLNQLKKDDETDYDRRTYNSVKSFDEFMSQQSTIPEELGFNSQPTATLVGRKYSEGCRMSYMESCTEPISEVKQEIFTAATTAAGAQAAAAAVPPAAAANRRASHITSEQKRRRGINDGFDLLDTLCCSATGRAAGRTSRAAILKNGADVCRQLHSELSSMEEEGRRLRREIESLSSNLGTLQQQLPAGGARTSKSTREKLTRMLDQHVTSKASENWLYGLFGEVVVRKLFGSYMQLCSSADSMDWKSTILHWLDDYCSLAAIRPLINQSVFELCKSTSILTDPSNLPHELYRLGAARRPPSSLASEVTAETTQGSAATTTTTIADIEELETQSRMSDYEQLPAPPSFFR